MAEWTFRRFRLARRERTAVDGVRDQTRLWAPNPHGPEPDRSGQLDRPGLDQRARGFDVGRERPVVKLWVERFDGGLPE